MYALAQFKYGFSYVCIVFVNNKVFTDPIYLSAVAFYSTFPGPVRFPDKYYAP